MLWFTKIGLPKSSGSIPICHWYLSYYTLCWMVWSEWSWNLHINVKFWGAFSCSWPHSKLGVFQVTWHMDLINTSEWGTCYFQNPNRPTKHCISWYCVKGTSASNWRTGPGKSLKIKKDTTWGRSKCHRFIAASSLYTSGDGKTPPARRTHSNAPS